MSITNKARNRLNMNYMKKIAILLIFITGLFSSAIAQNPVTVFATGTSWKYNDTGTDLGTLWRNSSYNDASWSSGNAILGYGTINAGTINTTLSYGGNSSNKYPTYYFRKNFTYSTTGNETYYKVTALIDDGAVFYVNGTEVYRHNMPSGTISYSDYASGTGDEDNYFSFTIPKSAISNGSNVFAVEVHQRSGNSSDVGMDLGLEAHFDLDLDYIHFGTKNNPLDRLRIIWRDKHGIDSLKWGYTTAYSQGTHIASSRALFNGDSLYEYSFPALNANSTIHYKIYSAYYSAWSQDFSFNTSVNPSSDHFKFSVLGDSRTNYSDWETVSKMLPETDFTIFTGDIVENGSNTSDWDSWFEYGDDFNKAHLVYHSLGNHEAQSGGYQNDTNIFVLPESSTGKELYYSFTFGNAIFICLNSEDPGNSTQYNWLLSTLSANVDKTWKVVFFHKPFYTEPTHTADMHGYWNTWWKAFDDYGVDLIFNGHTHNYQRTVPINRNVSTTSAVNNYGSCTNSGRCQIVSGRAGAPSYGAGSAWFIEKSTGDLNFVTVEITGDSCNIVARNSSNTVIDSFMLIKDFTVAMSSTPEGPPGAKNGSATATPSGGASPYTYLWDNNATTATISNLDSGWYHVTVKDDDLCQLTDSVHVDTTMQAQYVTTEPATNIQLTSATLNSSVNPPSGGFIFGLEFELGTTTSYGTTVASNPNYSGSNTTTTGNATGLATGTLYHYRIKGTDGSTTYYGGDETFTTLAPQPPTVVMGSDFTNVSGTTAENTANEVTSDGGATITERGMVYGTSVHPTTSSNKKSASGTTGLFDITLLNLNYGTTYYARAYAINSEGTSYSSTEKSFTTEPQTQATITSITRDPASPTYATVYFTYGSGDGFMLIIKESYDVDTYPVDGTDPNTYYYDANYGNGYNLGNGNYVVYNGSHSKGDITVGNLDPNKEYYFAALEYSGSGTNANYRTSDAATIGTDDAVLPIVLIDFKAYLLDSVVKIDWTTASETNNEKFEIQRSADGLNFATIGELAGAGNSNRILKYEFVDKSPFKGLSYYRLKQKDFDGKYSFGKIVWVINEENKNSHISSITTSNNNISFICSLPQNSNVSVELLDVNGKRVYRKENVGKGKVTIPVSTCKSGVYFIRLISAGNVEVEKVLLVR